MTSEEVRKLLASIPNIHKGGCLISAYAFYLHEQKMGRLSPNFQVVALDNEERYVKLELNKDFFKGRNKLGCSHFAWANEDGLQDAYGKVNNFNYEFRLASDIDKFCLTALNYHAWNWRFDREYWVPIIAQKLNVDLSQIYVHKGKANIDWATQGGYFRKRRKFFGQDITQLHLDLT